MRYSVTSVTMADLTMVEQAALLQRLGFDGIEWRVRRVSPEDRASGDVWRSPRNDLTPENVAEKAEEMKRVAADHNLAIAGIASALPATDLEQVRLLVEGAVKCGAPFIRVGASRGYDGTVNYYEIYEETMDAYAKAVAVADGSGVKLLLELHGGTIHPSVSLVHRIVSHFPPERVGVIYDPQNLVTDGYETTELALDLLGAYVAHCHVGGHRWVEKGKDGTGTTEWEWPSTSMADGLYDHRRLLRKLKQMNYPGFITIEDFRALRHEVKLREELAYLRRVESAV